jgi:hypothetical protein
MQIAAAAWAIGCGDDGAAPVGSGSGNATTTSDPTVTGDASSSTSSDDGSLPDAPPSCDGLSSPFVSAECLGGLRDRCRAAMDVNDCAATEAIVFDDGAYVIACGWAKVVAFSDVDTCTIASVIGRCEAGIEQLIPCADRCTGEPDLYASLRASVPDAELVEMPCTLDGRILDGPLGPSSAVGAPPGDGSTCAPNIQPPAPEICTCATEACAAD